MTTTQRSEAQEETAMDFGAPNWLAIIVSVAASMASGNAWYSRWWRVPLLGLALGIGKVELPL